MDESVIYVGLDDGYAATKLVASNGVQLRVPSRARAGAHGVSSVMGGASETMAYSTEGQRFTVGGMIEGEATRFDDYPVSPLNRVIVHHALQAAGLGGLPVHLVTGLPVAAFFTAGEVNRPLITAKQENLAKPVQAMSGEPMARLVGQSVYAEGVCAFIDYVVSDAGDTVADMHALVAVVDIGGRTTDCVTVSGGDIDHAKTGTGYIGVLDVIEMAAAQLCRQFEVETLSDGAVEAAVRTGRMRIYGRDHDVTGLIAGVIEEVGARIYREIMRQIGRAHEVDTVLFVGGGALLFADLLGRFRNGQMAPSPEFANARGMLKYARFVAG